MPPTRPVARWAMATAVTDVAQGAERRCGWSRHPQRRRRSAAPRERQRRERRRSRRGRRSEPSRRRRRARRSATPPTRSATSPTLPSRPGSRSASCPSARGHRRHRRHDLAIAAQTNLLALNAAKSRPRRRAGQGLPAVVAQVVRSRPRSHRPRRARSPASSSRSSPRRASLSPTVTQAPSARRRAYDRRACPRSVRGHRRRRVGRQRPWWATSPPPCARSRPMTERAEHDVSRSPASPTGVLGLRRAGLRVDQQTSASTQDIGASAQGLATSSSISNSLVARSKVAA